MYNYEYYNHPNGYMVIIYTKNGEIMSWFDVLNCWITKNKKFHKIFTQSLKKPKFNFMLKCIPLTKYTINRSYISVCFPNKKLPVRQSFKPFKSYIDVNCGDKYNTSFYNKDNTTYLLIPCPVKSKNFATIKYYNKNSTVKHSLMFWKSAGENALDFYNNGIPVWINSHGTGVSFLHLRYDLKFKYSVELQYPFNKLDKITRKSFNLWYDLY